MSPEDVAVWEQVTRDLATIGVLHRTDGRAIARYCSLLVRWVASKKFIEKFGYAPPIKDEAGKVTGFGPMFPQAADFKNLLPGLIQLEREFGLTPASRASLSVQPQKTDDEKEARFFG